MWALLNYFIIFRTEFIETERTVLDNRYEFKLILRVCFKERTSWLDSLRLFAGRTD